MSEDAGLDKIADDIGTVTEEQEDDNSKTAREGEEFDDEEYRRNKDDYDGDW